MSEELFNKYLDYIPNKEVLDNFDDSFAELEKIYNSLNASNENSSLEEVIRLSAMSMPYIHACRKRIDFAKQVLDDLSIDNEN